MTHHVCKHGDVGYRGSLYGLSAVAVENVYPTYAFLLFSLAGDEWFQSVPWLTAAPVKC